MFPLVNMHPGILIYLVTGRGKQTCFPPPISQVMLPVEAAVLTVCLWLRQDVKMPACGICQAAMPRTARRPGERWLLQERSLAFQLPELHGGLPQRCKRIAGCYDRQNTAVCGQRESADLVKTFCSHSLFSHLFFSFFFLPSSCKKAADLAVESEHLNRFVYYGFKIVLNWCRC